MEDGSPRYKLSRQDAERIAVGAGIAAAGAGLTYLSDIIPNIDWGTWTPVVTALFAVIVNAFRKWVSDTR